MALQAKWVLKREKLSKFFSDGFNLDATSTWEAQHSWDVSTYNPLKDKKHLDNVITVLSLRCGCWKLMVIGGLLKADDEMYVENRIVYHQHIWRVSRPASGQEKLNCYIEITRDNVSRLHSGFKSLQAQRYFSSGSGKFFLEEAWRKKRACSRKKTGFQGSLSLSLLFSPFLPKRSWERNLSEIVILLSSKTEEINFFLSSSWSLSSSSLNQRLEESKSTI